MTGHTPGQSGTRTTDASNQMRTAELELWDRILTRWNGHIGQQVKIAVGVVTFVVLLVGFLGLRTIDKMVEDSVTKAVEKQIAELKSDVENDTKRLSDQMADKLAAAIVDAATFQAQMKKVEDMLTKMTAESARFEEMDTRFQEQLKQMQANTARYDSLAKEISERYTTLKASLVELEGNFATARTSIANVRTDLARVDRIASSVALATASKPTPRPAGRTVEPRQDILASLQIRQVPTTLGPMEDQPSRIGYLLNLSASFGEPVSPDTERDVMNSIDSITYTFDSGWFDPNEFKQTNRSDNFRFTITVWGPTVVRAKAQFVGKSPPLCWEGRMDLGRETTLQRVACT